MFLCLFSINLFCYAESVVEIDQNSSLSCISESSVSLDEDCTALIDPLDILSAVYPFQTFQIELRDRFGDIIPNGELNSDHLWTTISARVTSNETGNTCWGFVVVEDKLAPEIFCDDYTINCFDDNDYLPIHYDACTVSELELKSQIIDFVPCDPMINKTITKSYVAIDAYGNESLPCTQVISIAIVDLDIIVFPPSYELMNDTELICSQVDFDENGFPLVEQTLVPTYLGEPIYPVNELCSVVVQYEDLVINTDGCFKKFMRTWNVYQEDCGVIDVETYQQIIEIADTEDPIVFCPDPISVNTDGSPGCDAIVQLGLASYEDDCSEVIEMDIVTPVGFFNNVTEAPSIELLSGVNQIQYTVYDGCENFAICTTTVTVVDNAPPTARCDESSVVSLRSDGTAIAKAFSFDEGSFDDCSLYKNFIKRIDDPCGCPIPQFDDMNFLGEYQDHYYYISTIERYGFEAFNYSEAMGGHILKTETITEHSWVNSKIRETSNDSYLIGLKDRNDNDVFQWHDYTISNLNLWETNNPGMDECVVVNANGNWETVNANSERYFFVLELDTPCNFSDRIYFCCEDAGQEVPLVLRVVDSFGRYNDCEFTTEIQDKIAPTIVCPSNRVLDCSTDIDTTQLDVYGVATATDQCLAIITSDFIMDVNQCGVGEIIRTFYAADANGVSDCEQVLSFEMFGLPVEQEVIWPFDYESDLGCLEGDLAPEMLPDGFGFPDFTQTDCSILNAEYSDRVYSFGSTNTEACFKVIRTWTVTDECLIDQMNYEPLTYEQVLKISNSSAPDIITGCQDITINTDDCNEELVEFSILAMDDCTSDDVIRGSFQLDLDSDGMGDFDFEVDNLKNSFNFSEILEVGNHFALIEFRDQCGNANTCTKLISVESNVGPLAKCVPGLVAVIQDMDLDGDGNIDAQMAMMRAESLDAGGGSLNMNGSSHPCGNDIDFSFSADPDDQVVIFNCDDYGEEIILELWVTDEFGNTAVCSTLVEVQDESNRCGRPEMMNIEIGGEIFTSLGQKLEGVVVDLIGSNMDPVVTDEEGRYVFPSMSAGAYYTVKAIKNDNPLAGVSTLDLLKIQRHILGLELLDGPYNIIAADIDKSGDITAKDMIELRKLILGIYDVFPNNESWRMLDAQYQFASEEDPLGENLPSDYEIFKLSKSMQIDFTGIKTGDVDNSINISSNDQVIASRSRSKQYLILEETKLGKDIVHELKFSLEDMESLNGFQLQMNFDSDLCDILAFKSGGIDISVNNLNMDWLEHGIVRLSWSDSNVYSIDEEVLFTILVKTKKETYTSELFQLDNMELNAELYLEQKAIPLDINFKSKDKQSKSFFVYQNAPNPWNDMTTVKYYSEINQNIEFSVYDINGKLVYKQIRDANAGVNNIDLFRHEINASGILYYELSTVDQKIIKKMVLLD